ncbi:maleylpyruvate isomerase family mycothiol-dependent enzyme [Arthrobacter sp. OY3WO11]|uniref:maleylpyruvate isomerase family mycothiol-dependent enzyme n=1 Tax=Arthrobacter sp. OY3WO11 TaxID=1835723 RepID=UPI0007D03A7E|nr:maleylpyruvate isomerase family mycothiol-dependent enzyme [Arthrobacter sp. OY3WO11]OAE01625.1 mycothiol-dependent maleylpyruvate isomerase [Arthrobacter sp. OY3WO11]
MTTPARLHSDLSRLGRETDMFLATVASLSDDEMAGPSLCDGWSRAHVIAHVAANGRALVQFIDWAATGEERRLHASPEARAEAIATLAALPREELLAELRASAGHFAEQAQRLSGTLVAQEISLNRSPLPSASIVALRIAEVVVHHQDLDTAWTIEEADPDSLLDALEAAVRSLGAKDAPGMTLVTEERDKWIIGDGTLRVESDREGLLQWLARGDATHIEAEGQVPALPRW